MLKKDRYIFLYCPPAQGRTNMNKLKYCPPGNILKILPAGQYGKIRKRRTMFDKPELLNYLTDCREMSPCYTHIYVVCVT